MSYQCSQCQYAFEPFADEAVGPFCDCPQCGGLAVEAQSSAAPVGSGRNPDPFVQPETGSGPLMGPTGTRALSPGLFDNYFAEAATSGVAPAPEPTATPFDNVEDEPLSTGDIHREPTMLLSDERSVANVTPASPAEVSLPSAATPSVDPYAFAQEAFTPAPGRAEAVDPMQTQQGQLAPREVSGVRDMHDELTHLAGSEAPAPVPISDLDDKARNLAEADSPADPFAEISDPGSRPPDASLDLYGDDEVEADQEDHATWVESYPGPENLSEPDVAAAPFDQDLIATLPRPPGAELSDPRQSVETPQTPFASLLPGELPGPEDAAGAESAAILPREDEPSSWPEGNSQGQNEVIPPQANAESDDREWSGEMVVSADAEASLDSLSGEMLVSSGVLNQGDDVDGQMLVDAPGPAHAPEKPNLVMPADRGDDDRESSGAALSARSSSSASSVDTQEVPTRTARLGRKKRVLSSTAVGSERGEAQPRLLSGSFFFAVVLVAAVMSALGLIGGYLIADSGRKAAPLTGPARARLLLGQGHKLLHENSNEEALQALRQALRNDPTLPEIQRALGTAYGRLGKTDKAAKAYRYYVKLAPNASDAEAIRQMLARHLGQISR